MPLPAEEFPPQRPIENSRELADFFARAAAPDGVGLALEAFPYRLSSGAAAGFSENRGLRDFLTGLALLDWQPVFADSDLVGARRGGTEIALGAGGQIILTCAAAADMHRLAQETDAALTDINRVGEPLDIGFSGLGWNPQESAHDIPGARLAALRAAAQARGAQAEALLLRGAAAEIRITYADEADMGEKLRLCALLQPVATALFATAPFGGEGIGEWQSPRMRALCRIEEANGPLLPLLLEPHFGFERYAQWALDRPLLYLERGGQYLDTRGLTFRRFLESGIAGEGRATFGDWQNHLRGIAASAALAPQITLRGADAGPSEMAQAAAALWAGLLFDARARREALTLTEGWKAGDAAQFALDAARLGFRAEIEGISCVDLAHTLVTLAVQGLRRRARRLNGGPDESRHAQVMFDYTESNHSRADEMRMQAAAGNLTPLRILQSCRLVPPADAGGADIDFL